VGRFTFGAILGVAIGILDVLLMLPLAFPDKRAALLGASVAGRREDTNQDPGCDG